MTQTGLDCHSVHARRRNFSLCSHFNFYDLYPIGNPKQKLISRPDKPTRVFIGENVSLAWRYYHPSNFKLYEVVLGIWKSSTGTLATKLVAVNGSGFVQVRTGYESRISWAGNLTSFLAVFVFYNVQPANGNKVFGMHVEYDLNSPLTDTVRLQVETKRKWHGSNRFCDDYSFDNWLIIN